MAAAEPPCPPGLLASEHKDVPKTLAKWQRTLDWRAEFDVDSILKEPQKHYEIIKHACPHAFHGRSREGDVILYHSLGNINWALLDANDVSFDCLVRHFVFTLEFICQQLLQPGDGGQCIIVFSICTPPCAEDGPLSSASPTNATPPAATQPVPTMSLPPQNEGKRSFELLQACLVLLGAYYPERVRVVLLMHLPWGVSSPLWTMTTRYLDPILREKLRVVRSEENTALMEYIDAKDVPSNFGDRSLEATPDDSNATGTSPSSLLGSAVDELALNACAQTSLQAPSSSSMLSSPSDPPLRGRSHHSGSIFLSPSLSSMSQHTWPSSGVSSGSSSQGCSSAASSTEADSSLGGSLGGSGHSNDTGMSSPASYPSSSSRASYHLSNLDDNNANEDAHNGPLSRTSSHSPSVKKLSKAKRAINVVSFTEDPPRIGSAAGDGVDDKGNEAPASFQKYHPRAATPPPARIAQEIIGSKEADFHDVVTATPAVTVELKRLLKSDCVVVQHEKEGEQARVNESGVEKDKSKPSGNISGGFSKSPAQRSGSSLADHVAKVALTNEASNTNFAQEASTEELVRLYLLHKAFVAPSAAALEEDQLDVDIDTLADTHPEAAVEAEALDVSVNLSDLSRSCLDVEGGLDGGTSVHNSAPAPLLDAPTDSDNVYGRDSSHNIGIGEGSVAAPSVHSLAISVASSFRASMSFMLEAPPLIPSDGQTPSEGYSHASHEERTKSLTGLSGEFSPAPRPSSVKQRKATPGRGRTVDSSPGGSRPRKLSRGNSGRSESKDSTRGSSSILDRRSGSASSSSTSSTVGRRSSSASGRVAASPLRGRIGAPSEGKQNPVTIVASPSSRSRSNLSSISSSSTGRARSVGGTSSSSSRGKNAPQARPPSTGRPKQSRLKGSTTKSTATSTTAAVAVTVLPSSTNAGNASSPKVSPSSGPPSPIKTRSRVTSPARISNNNSADDSTLQPPPLVSLAAAATAAAAAASGPVKASPRSARGRSLSSSNLGASPTSGRARSISVEVSPAVPRRDPCGTYPPSSSRMHHQGATSSSGGNSGPIAKGSIKPRPSKPRVVR